MKQQERIAREHVGYLSEIAHQWQQAKTIEPVAAELGSRDVGNQERQRIYWLIKKLNSLV